MDNTILDAITTGATALATLLSAISVWQLRSEKKARDISKITNLSITPKAKLFNCIDEVFFLKLAFSNESSLPISVMDLKLSLPGRRVISSSKTGEGGTSISDSIPVSESLTRYLDSKVVTRNEFTFALPITIAPYSSLSGYFAFHAGKQDSAILCDKEVIMKVRTSRKTFEFEMSLSCCNFYDFSYKDDGTVFGDACG